MISKLFRSNWTLPATAGNKRPSLAAGFVTTSYVYCLSLISYPLSLIPYHLDHLIVSRIVTISSTSGQVAD